MAFLRSSPSFDEGELIYGAGVVLRAPAMPDYDAWAQLRESSRAFLTPWEPTWSSDELTRAAFRRRVRYYSRDMREDTGYAMFVFRMADDALLGGLTLSNVRRGVTQAATLGYWIGASHASRGYMTAAVRALAPIVFDDLRLHRLEAACLPDNTASMRLLERTGFKREGFARSYLKINGAWRDHVLYALLDSDPRS